MFAEADRDMQTVISKAKNKADAHFSYARLIYSKELRMHDVPYAQWSYGKVAEEAQKAYDIDPQPLYQHLLYQALYAQDKYKEAYDGFMSLTKTNFRNPELFYEAALSRKQMGANTDEALALIDSAVVNTDTLRFNEAAPYFMARGDIEREAGRYRDAVFDYARVELLMQGRMSADFYYMREQVEIKAKLFQQAVSDINRAIALDSQEPLYYAEKASLLLRVNKKEEALDAARQCVGIAPEYADGHLVLGMALVQTDQRAEGLQHLQRARELGSAQAEELIAKYQ
jgi:tetratricopeptide (TPR) repeat protein